MVKPLPADVQVAIIGVGIVGCATAYHLAKASWSAKRKPYQRLSRRTYRRMSFAVMPIVQLA